MIDRSCIVNVSMAEYLADPCESPSLNSGTAHRLIAESPLHAWHQHPRLGKQNRASSAAADTGSTAHDLLLGGEGKICVIDPNDYPAKTSGAIPDGWTNNAIRAARDEARSNGLIPMLKGDMISVRAMVAAAKGYIAASDIPEVFDRGEPELTVIAREGDTYLRTRPDWLNLDAGISLSYKTTQASVHPDSFTRMMASMGYDFSMVFYERALKSAHEGKVRHLILAQEQKPPYACKLYELSPAKNEMLRADVERAINIWRMCLESKSWHGYGGDVHVVEPKPWEVAGAVEISYE